MDHYSITTASAYLPSTDDIVSFTIPTKSPVSQLESTIPTLAQSDQAISSTSFFPSHSRCSGFVLARVVEDGYVLELRWMTFVRGSRLEMEMGREGETENPFAELDDSSSDLPPIRFIFPARIVSNPFLTLVVGSQALQVRILTHEGYLYSLMFKDSTLFYSSELADRDDWSEEYKVGSLEGRRPALLHGVAEGFVVIGCTDSFLVRVTHEGELRPVQCFVTFHSRSVYMTGQSYQEVELKSNSSFSVRSLLPSFSTRNLSPSAVHSSPGQVLSFASASMEGSAAFGFSVSRDRKLKIWNLETGSCLRAIDLPRPSAPNYDIDNDSHNNGTPSSNRKTPLLLAPIPTPFVKIINGDDDSTYASYLVLFVPASAGSPPGFFIYGIVLDPTGVVRELAASGEKTCPSTSASLIDFDAIRFDLTSPLQTNDASWNLWTVWEEGGESEIRYINLPELGGAIGAALGEEDDDAIDWKRIESGSISGSTWTAGHFDELLLDETRSILDVFTQHIFHPNRYSPSTLQYALEFYESTLVQELDLRYLPDVFTVEYETIAQRLLAIVGSSIELEISPSTGATLYDAYNKRLKVEWLRFVAICNESRTAALFPTSLSCDAERGVVMMIMRDAIAVPIIQDTILTLKRAEHNAEEGMVLATLQPHSLEFSYPQLAPPGIRNDLATLISTMTLMSNHLPGLVMRQLESALLDNVRSNVSRDIEDVALDLFDSHLAPHIDDILQEQISANLNGLLSPEATFQTLWTILTTPELSRPVDQNLDDSSRASEITSALLTDYIATTIEARYSVIQGLIVVLLYVYGEEDGLIPQLSSLTNATFATFHTLASLYWIISQPSIPILDRDLSTDEGILERFGDMTVTGSDSPASTPVSSLLNGLIRDRYAPPISAAHSLPFSLATSACVFLSSTGLISQKRSITASPEDVEFAMRLFDLRLPHLALDYVLMYPQETGMSHVKGLALLTLDRAEEAQIAFEKVAPALCKLNRSMLRSMQLNYDI
jgi:nuclear pore complex protein Nup160